MRKTAALLLILLIILLTVSDEAAAMQEAEEASRKIGLADGAAVYEYTLKDLGLAFSGRDRDGELIKCADPGLLSYKLFLLSQQVKIDPVNARLYQDEQKALRIEPGKAGRRLDLAALITELGNIGPYRERYELPFLTVSPAVTAQDLERQYPRQLWAQYSTALVNIPDRTENVRLASAQLDGLLIGPGQAVSFNETVGPREADRGFKSAMIIVGGRFIDGLGGGVCQVSSTLYNVLLEAGLEIRERHPHSLPIAYVPPGRDATVVYGLKDLVFANNTPGLLLLKAQLEGLTLTISLYGPESYTVPVL